MYNHETSHTCQWIQVLNMKESDTHIIIYYCLFALCLKWLHSETMLMLQTASSFLAIIWSKYSTTTNNLHITLLYNQNNKDMFQREKKILFFLLLCLH